MRKLIVVVLFLIMTLYAQSVEINGIRIESDGVSMMVFIDGQQMCTPTLSCFIANLKSGFYLIEVYESVFNRYNSTPRRGELLYRERFFYDSYSLEEIRVGKNESDHAFHDNIMPPETFDKFLGSLKKKSFDSDKDQLIEIAMLSSDFTSEQCLRMLKIYSFNSGMVSVLKKLYPRVIDKQNFFSVIDCLTFQSDQNTLREFVKQYHQR